MSLAGLTLISSDPSMPHTCQVAMFSQLFWRSLSENSAPFHPLLYHLMKMAYTRHHFQTQNIPTIKCRLVIHVIPPKKSRNITRNIKRLPFIPCFLWVTPQQCQQWSPRIPAHGGGWHHLRSTMWPGTVGDGKLPTQEIMRYEIWGFLDHERVNLFFRSLGLRILLI